MEIKKVPKTLPPYQISIQPLFPSSTHQEPYLKYLKFDLHVLGSLLELNSIWQFTCEIQVNFWLLPENIPRECTYQVQKKCLLAICGFFRYRSILDVID